MRSRNHFCRGKAISMTYCDCVSVALVVQHTMRNAPYCHLWPLLPYHIFPHYLKNGTIFGKELQNRKCVLIFSRKVFSEIFLILEEFSEILS
jgi:hypothetical protein